MQLISAKSSKLSNSLGNFEKIESIQGGIQGSTSNGVFKVVVYKEGVFRISVLQNPSTFSHSYAVVSKPENPSFSIEEDEEKIQIISSNCTLSISKFPVRFTFLTPDNKVINEDDPGFGTSWIGEQVATYKKLQEDEKFLGLGEKTGPLNRKGKGYVNWNTDHFAYGPEADPLYCSIPFYIGVHNELTYGIFFDNSHKTHFNFGASNDRFSSFSADQGEMDYYFFYGNGIPEIIEKYTWLTGRMTLPPLWSLGYQQCRYSYYPESEVQNVADTFRVKDIPADTIVLDIHYMEKYKIFTFDGERFPNPTKMIESLRKKGFNIVVIFDPGIKVEKGYGPYDDGIKKDVFIKYPDGEPYSGEVWPGWCHFPDFSNPKTRDWWAKQMKYYSKIGISGFWNDMNEIATWGQYLPELIQMDFEGDPASMRKGRNVYGMLMARSTYEGALASNPEKRPFNLTRSGFSGIQRYAAVWTGDNVASDEHMMAGVRLVNSLGLSGVAFTGYDVGGFAGNANENLFARWIQLGAFSPFFRGHSMINSRDSEPWAFGEEVEDIARNYIKLRYKFMMYLYSSMKEAATSGMPVARSMAIYHPHDEKIYEGTFQNQYYFGPSVLVAPVESWKDLLKVYFPKGTWYEFFTDTVYNEGVHIVDASKMQLPVFVKGGAIIPISPEVGRNTQNLGKDLEYHIYNGDEENHFDYFEDDGISVDTQQAFYTQKISFNPTQKEIILKQPEGNFKSSFENVRLVLHGFEKANFSLNGEKVKDVKSSYRFIEPISSFDPFGNENGAHLKIAEVLIIKIPENNIKTVLKWSELS
ncbi:MAG: glycoside hydrolase family 31 protein [Cyclobacteriaceae bacterium]|nr:glycoside hydrolase family 31 protein [Cyclobacteriaceae bacterium]